VKRSALPTVPDKWPGKATQACMQFLRALVEGKENDAEFARLYNAMFGVLKAIWRSSGYRKTEEDIEDLFHKFMLHLIEKRAHLDLSRPVLAYMRRMAINFEIDQYRHDRTRKEKEVPNKENEDGVSEIDRAAVNAHDIIYKSITDAQRLAEALTKVSEADKTLINLAATTDCNVDEMAKILNISKLAAKKRLDRALKRARPEQVSLIILEEAKAADRAVARLQSYLRRNDPAMALQHQSVPMHEVTNNVH